MSDKYISYQSKSLSNLTVLCSQTYMNLSGRALDSFLKKNSTVLKADILVMHDDLQHKFGNVRIKEKGSA